MSKPSIEGTGALFQIAEPSAPQASPRAPGYGIGIDLGTTRTVTPATSSRSSSPVP